ncbi:Autophagy-related protein 17 [Lecanora helva]
MTSSSSSLPLPSPNSPRQQAASSTPTSALESLIPHLLASKRSLSSISHVYRANEICSSTRHALENSAVLTARSTFLRSGICSQLEILQKVQTQTARSFEEGRAELMAAVRGLDKADQRLRGTLDKLRDTLVEVGLRPEGDERKNLVDFVDESGVDGLIETIKTVIDGASESINQFEGANRGFAGELKGVEELLDEQKETVVGRPNETIPDVLHEMEGFAKSMARELEGLVTHYDMCVTAVKHTEGGGDAATKIANKLPEGVDIGQDVAGPPEPMDDEERKELISVIENDAGDVDGAVTDIRSHLVEMESLHERVNAYTDQLSENHKSAITAFKLLEATGQKLPNYVTLAEMFIIRWDGDKAKIEERLEELEGLTQFFEGFLKAYDNLLIEIGRRKTVEQKIDQEVQAAKDHLERLYDDEVEEREVFRKEQGDFLPVDIWPGLMAGPLRFDITPTGEETRRIPDISKSAIHRAIKRVHGGR